MTRYSVPLVGYVNTAVTVETDETDPEKIAELAQEQIDVGSLCHQCGRTLDLGDDWTPVRVDGKPEVYRTEER